MKVYMVQETGGVYEDAYKTIHGICSTQDRAVALLEEKATEKEESHKAVYGIGFESTNVIVEFWHREAGKTPMYGITVDDDDANPEYIVYEIEVLE